MTGFALLGLFCAVVVDGKFFVVLLAIVTARIVVGAVEDSVGGGYTIGAGGNREASRAIKARNPVFMLLINTVVPILYQANSLPYRDCSVTMVLLRGCGLTVGRDPSKVEAGVQFPPPATSSTCPAGRQGLSFGVLATNNLSL